MISGILTNKINRLVLCCLILLCSSCARSLETQTAADNFEPADTACSYFYFLWGKTAELDHRYDEALEAYEKVLVCDGRAVYVMRDLAILLVKMGREQDAASWFKKILRRAPDDTGVRMLLAKLYAGMGKVDEAVKTYNELLKIEDDPRTTLLMLGSLYARDRQYDKAKDVLNRLIELDRSSYLGHYSLARLNRDMHLFNEALIEYEKALAVNWSVPLAFEMAALYEREKRFDDAGALYRRILEEDDSNERALAGIINIYLVTSQYDKALAELRELKNYSANVRMIDLAVGRVLLSQGKYDEAIAVLSPIIQEDPKMDAARYMLAIAYHYKGDSAEAKKLLAMIAPAAREFEDSVFMLVKILRDEDKDETGAINILEKEIGNENSRRIGFYVVLATLYRRQKQTDKAAATFERALKAYPDNPAVFYEYALFLDRIGNQDEAMVKMQEVLRLDQDNAYALNYVGYTWADRNMKLKEALKYLKKAVSLKPDDGYIRDSLGWAYFKAGDIKRAVVELEKAIDMVADDPAINEHLGDAYLKAKDISKARAAYEKAIEYYKDDNKKKAVRRKAEDLIDRK